MQVEEVPARSILHPTGGFLREGFTHTINLYRGCALGNSLCGTFCYAQWNAYHTRGRPWGSFLDVKTGIREAYRRDYDRLKRPPAGPRRPLRIYMSSVTEPYPPQESVESVAIINGVFGGTGNIRDLLGRAPRGLNATAHANASLRAERASLTDRDASLRQRHCQGARVSAPGGA